MFRKRFWPVYGYWKLHGRFEMFSSLGSGFKYSPVQLNSISCLKRWPYHHSKKFAVVIFLERVYIFGMMDGIQVFLKPIYDLVSMICFWTVVHLNYLIVIANPISFSWWSGSFVAGGFMWRQCLHASSFDMGGQLEAIRYYWVHAQIVCCCYSTIYPWKLRVVLPPMNNNCTAWYPSCSNRRIQNN